MINPDDDFPDDNEPLNAPSAENQEQGETAATRRAPRRTAQKISTAAGESWAQTKQRAGNARERAELFLRENPVPTILGALVVGLGIGLAIRYASTHEDEKEVKVKTPLGDFSWGFLSLPFLWPFFKSVKEKYVDSADAVKEGVGRVRNIDVHRYTKPIRKRWKNWTR
ncbi:MAG: hypothetical protein ABR514_03845 [Chthoniobacterales bacterium]